MTKTKKKTSSADAKSKMDIVIAAMEEVNPAEADGSSAAANGKLPKELPILSGIQKPVFPGMVFPVLLTEDADISAARAAMAAHDRLIGFAMHEPGSEEVEGNKKKELKLFRVGTAAFIRRSEETTEGHLNIFCQARFRIILKQVKVTDGRVMAKIEYPQDIPGSEGEIKALCLAIKDAMFEIVSRSPMFTDDAKAVIQRYSWNAPGSLADFAVTLTSAEGVELQDVLNELRVQNRLEKALWLLKREGELSKLKEDLSNKVEAKMNKSQREFFYVSSCTW